MTKHPLTADQIWEIFDLWYKPKTKIQPRRSELAALFGISTRQLEKIISGDSVYADRVSNVWFSENQPDYVG